ncbi:hypothetical protein [Algibacter lectus]|nr:hypothetical protein [Algibacter lectus]
MATVLGLGFFLMTVRFFYFSKSKIFRYLDLIFVLLFAFRAIVTFSRGGVFTAIFMIVAFIFILYKVMDKRNKSKMRLSIILFLIIGIVTWGGISASQTNGMIEKRYANENAAGQEKNDVTTGRGEFVFIRI